MSDELDEVVESFKEIDRFIIKGAADMRTLQSSISSTNAILESKGWEIFSRFISGTGLWRIQNRVKASIQLINAAMSAEERRRVKEAKKLKTLAEIGRFDQSIQKMRDKINRTTDENGNLIDENIKKLREESDTFSALFMQYGDAGKALDALNQKMDEQQAIADKLINKARKRFVVDEEAAKKRITFEKAKQVREEKGFKAALQYSVGINRKLEKEQEIRERLQALGFDESKQTVVLAAAKEASQRMATVGPDGKLKRGQNVFKGIPGGVSKEQIEELIKINNEIENASFSQTILAKAIRKRVEKITERVKAIKDGVVKFVKGLFKMFGIFLLISFVLMTIVALLKPFAANIKDGFDMFVKVFSAGIAMIVSGTADIIRGLSGIIKAIVSADIELFLESAMQMLGGILEVLGGVFVATIGSIIAGLLTVVTSVFTDGFNSAKTALGGIIAGIASVTSFLARVVMGVALVVATIGALTGAVAVLPALVVAGIALIIFKVADFIFKHADKIAYALAAGISSIRTIFIGLELFMNNIATTLKSLPMNLANAVKDALEGPAKSIKGLGGKLKDGISGGFNAITGRAVGGPASGLTLVGEQGPELVKLPSGSRVHTNRQSAAMMGGVTNNITVQVTGRVGANDSEIRDIANKVAREINTRINRTSTSVVKF
jgi:hypothetical protein